MQQQLKERYTSNPEDNKIKVRNQKSYILDRESLIVAYCIISESELKLVYKDYTSNLQTENPTLFNNLLYDLGLDSTLQYLRQDGLWHRNRLNQIVLCSRFVGEERQDTAWINSGYASQEAKDKASRNKILEDLYRTRNLTKDTQAVLESRDYYAVIDESVWE